MSTVLALLALVMTVYLAEARHVHPRSIVRLDDEVTKSEALTKIDGIPIDVIRIMAPNRFVPINNAAFFMSNEPCEEGFQRDFLGVCREVWE